MNTVATQAFIEQTYGQYF